MFFSLFYLFIYLLFVVGKDIGQIYKHSQSQLSTSSFKAPVRSSSASKTSSSIELATTSVPTVRDKNQKICVLCSQNSIHNDVSIINNDDIHSRKTSRKKNCSIPITSTPNHHAQRIATTSASMLNLHTTTILPPVGK